MPKAKGRKVGKGRKSMKTAARAVTSDGLSGRRLLFVDYYLEHPNGTDAARRAGYSSGRADVEAAELLADPIVSAEIARRQAKLNQKFQISQERVLEEITALAFSDVTDLVEDGPTGVPQMKPVARWTPASRKSVSSVKVKRHDPVTDRSGAVIQEGYDIVEFKLWDKPGQLEKLLKRLDMAGSKGDELEGLTDAERIQKIAEILSRGRARKAGAQAA